MSLIDRAALKLRIEHDYGESEVAMTPFLPILRLIDAAPAAEPVPLTLDALMDAEHRWCITVEGDYALRHEVTAHRAQAEFILAALARPEPSVQEDPTDAALILAPDFTDYDDD